jgi:NADPH2 dehydrogenase
MSALFSPYTLRGPDATLVLPNRIVVAPMCQYAATEGQAGDWHLMHWGNLLNSGAAMFTIEATAVVPEGRITPACLGLWDEATEAALRTHLHRARKLAPEVAVCIQLAHAGRKASSAVPWAGGQLLASAQGGWSTLGPSALSQLSQEPPPQAMDRAAMDRVRDAFVLAAQRAHAMGVDAIEIHSAHGYLLHEFLSPIANQRADHYGGSLENRMRFPLEVFHAMRAAWPADKPISVRISATDWVEGGVDGDEAVRIGALFRDAGADLLDISAGQTSIRAKPVYGRMFQTPYADRVRNEAGIATMAVGNITEFDQMNSIIASGRADLVALARAHLANPHFTLHAAAQQGYRQQVWPKPYLAGKDQLERALARATS